MEPFDENPGPDLLSLPPAVLHNHVLPLLDAASLLRLGACCRTLAAAAHHDELWQHRCEALGWAPHTRGMTWQACYSYRRARLCVECHRPSRYVFALLGCRLCEACEHQVPRYSLVTRLEAIDRYGVQPAQLATLRYHQACRTAFYLRTQVEALSQSAGGNRRAAAQEESSDGEEEEEEDEEEEKEGQEAGLRHEDGEGGAESDGDEEGPSAGASAAAQRQAEEKAARKAAKKAAKEAQRMKRQLKATPGGASTSGAIKITYGQMASKKAAVGGGAGGRGNGASTSTSAAGGAQGRGAGSSAGRGPGDKQQQQQKGGARAGASPLVARAGGGGGGGRHRRGGQAAGSSPPGLRPAGPLLLALADADGDDGGGQALPLEGQAVPLPRSGGGGGGGGRSSRLPKLKSSWAAEREALMAEWGQFGISGLVLAT